MFFAKIWFVKTSTRVVKYESWVVKLNPVKVVAVGGFNLFKFKGKDVLSLLPDDKQEKSANHLEIDKEQVEQTLDIHQEHQTVYYDKTKVTQYSQFNFRSIGVFGTVYS